MKNLKKLSALVLALVLVFAMSVNAFAAETAGTVTLVIQRQDKDATAPTTYKTISDIAISDGDDVYDVVDKSVTADWETVAILDPETWEETGDYGEVLNGVNFTVGRNTYNWVNNGVSTPDETGLHGTYAGQSWTYSVVRGTATDEPEAYMDWYPVQAGDVIYINFEYSSFDW